MNKTITGYEIMNEKIKSFEEAADILLEDCPHNYNLHSDCVDYMDDNSCINCWLDALTERYDIEVINNE